MVQTKLKFYINLLFSSHLFRGTLKKKEKSKVEIQVILSYHMTCDVCLC